MNAHSHSSTEALSPYTRDGRPGPTRTFTLQKRFAQKLRGVLGRINALIREAVRERDLFGVGREALVDEPRDEIFDFPTRRDRVRGFLRWLRSQLDEQFLGVVGRDRNQFIRAAYTAGIRNAHQQLGDLDVQFERRDAAEIVSRPFHTSSLQTLYTRAFENLQSVRDDVAQEVRDELSRGFAEGKSPTDIGRALAGRVNSVGKNRATMIARSEVINAHTEGTLNRAEELNREAGVDTSVTHGEWDAAVGQARTCPFCRTVNGTPLTTSELRGQTVEFRGDTFRLAPPAHPNGRCNVSLRVGGTIDTPLSERLPEEVTLI